MRIGVRVLGPEEIGAHQVDLIQIAVYSATEESEAVIRQCAGRCREAGLTYVIHPVGYSLLRPENVYSLMQMAELGPAALILHDERSPDGGRLAGDAAGRFRSALIRLTAIVPVSFENAEDTGDIRWFWENWADSITLDIGHVEGAGLDPMAFTGSLDAETLGKIGYVHLHRYNGWHDGLRDHWPITPGCPEIGVFETLLERGLDPAVILEISGTEGVAESLDLLREMRRKRSRRS